MQLEVEAKYKPNCRQESWVDKILGLALKNLMDEDGAGKVIGGEKPYRWRWGWWGGFWMFYWKRWGWRRYWRRWQETKEGCCEPGLPLLLPATLSIIYCATNYHLNYRSARIAQPARASYTRGNLVPTAKRLLWTLLQPWAFKLPINSSLKISNRFIKMLMLIRLNPHFFGFLPQSSAYMRSFGQN